MNLYEWITPPAGSVEITSALLTANNGTSTTIYVLDDDSNQVKKSEMIWSATQMNVKESLKENESWVEVDDIKFIEGDYYIEANNEYLYVQGDVPAYQITQALIDSKVGTEEEVTNAKGMKSVIKWMADGPMLQYYNPNGGFLTCSCAMIDCYLYKERDTFYHAPCSSGNTFPMNYQLKA